MLKVAGPIMWNSLPEEIRNSQLVFTLKKNLKKHLIEQYESTLNSLGATMQVNFLLTV